MKLIDDKGRLFGKINIIDLLVILFLLGLAPIFYHGYKIANAPPPAPAPTPTPTPTPTPPKEIDLIVTVKYRSLLAEIANKIKKGEKGESLEILSVKTEDSEFVSSLNGKTFKNRLFNDVTLKAGIVAKEKNNDVTLKAGIVAKEKNNDYLFNNQPIKIGKNISISTNNFSLVGIIVNFKRK